MQSFSTQCMSLAPRHTSHRKGQVSRALCRNLSFFKQRVDAKLPSQVSTEAQLLSWGTDDTSCSILMQYSAPLLSLLMRTGTTMQNYPTLKHNPRSTACSAALNALHGNMRDWARCKHHLRHNWSPPNRPVSWIWYYTVTSSSSSSSSTSRIPESCSDMGLVFFTSRSELAKTSFLDFFPPLILGCCDTILSRVLCCCA